jgi:hypothetical protein
MERDRREEGQEGGGTGKQCSGSVLRVAGKAGRSRGSMDQLKGTRLPSPQPSGPLPAWAGLDCASLGDESWGAPSLASGPRAILALSCLALDCRSHPF